MKLAEIKKLYKATHDDTISTIQNFFTTLYHSNMKAIDLVPENDLENLLREIAHKSGKLVSITVEYLNPYPSVCFNITFNNYHQRILFHITNYRLNFHGVKMLSKMNEDHIVHFYDNNINEKRAKEIFEDCLISYNSKTSSFAVSTEFFDWFLLLYAETHTKTHLNWCVFHFYNSGIWLFPSKKQLLYWIYFV